MIDKKIFVVTGGAGFIGSALVRWLVGRGVGKVVVVDRLSYASNLHALDAVVGHPLFVFEQVDVCDSGALARVFETYQPDGVFHLAAETHVDRSIDSPEAFLQNNVMGTYRILEATRHYWMALDGTKQRDFRFLQVSTDEVFGDLPHPDDVGADEHSLECFHETSPYQPSSPYSASKAGADHLVRAWHRTYGLPVLVTNCSNNYGPFQHSEKLIPLVISHALSNKPLPIYGQGDQIRDWLFVEDHVRALWEVMQKARPGESYNVGGHNEVRNLAVVEGICNLLDELAPSLHGSLRTYHDLISFVADRPGHDRRYAIDARKIYEDLGWCPVETFETGLRKTVQWYLKHREAYL